jgi:hypothetical protein
MVERDETAYVQLKFRVKERLRAGLERAARGHGVSLNAEIVARLEKSFEPGFALDTSQVRRMINDALKALNALQGEVVDLVDELRQSEHQRRAIKIARGFPPVLETIFIATAALLAASEQEPSK